MDQKQMEIIRTRVQQIREESPWMEEYEIEAVICNEFSLAEFDSTSVLSTVKSMADPNSHKLPLPREEQTVSERLIENYSEIQPDAIGKFGAYEGVKTGPAQRRDVATRALYELAKSAENDEASSAIVAKARETISKHIRQESDRVGITLLLSVLIQGAMSLVLIVFTVLIMGWTLNDVYDFITKPSSMALLHAGLLLMAFAFPFITYIFIHKLPVGEMLPLHKLRRGEFLPMVGLGLGLMMVNGSLCNYISYPGAIRGANYSYEAVSFGNNATDIILTLFCLGIIPALIETFVFNGVVLQVMRRRGGDGFALVFSSLLYALMTTNFVEMPGAFITNLMIGYLVIFSGSLVPAVATRLIERILFFAITQLGFIVSDASIVQYADCFITIIFIALGIVSFFILIGRFPELFMLKKSDPCLTMGQKIRLASLRLPVLILALIAIVSSLLQIFDIDAILSAAEKLLYA